MPVELAPQVDVANGSAKPVGGCLEFDNPVTVLGPRPVVGESQKVKCSRAIVGSISVLGLARRWTEGYEFRLGGMDCQTVLAKTLRDDIHDTLGITLVAETDHEIIRIADQEGTSVKTRFDFLLEPKIQHIVQEHVRN